MAMAMDGLAKLAEELGELQQVVGKMLAYGAGEHPDGGKLLINRLEEEMADVCAAIDFVSITHKVNVNFVQERSLKKVEQFMRWHHEHY